MRKQQFGFIFLLSLILFTAIAIGVKTNNLDYFNLVISDKIHSIENPILTTIMKGISFLGEWFVYVPAAICFLIIPTSRRCFAVPAVVSLALSAILNILLKNILAVARPDTHRLISETGYGFPSGHAMNTTAFVGMIAIVLILRCQKIHSISQKAVVLTVSAVFILTMGFSRIYLGVHNPTDVLAGFAAGVLVVVATLFCLKIQPKGQY